MSHIIPIIVFSFMLCGCATKPPIASVQSNERYNINTDKESETIWRLAGYGEHDQLVKDKLEEFRQRELADRPIEKTPQQLQYENSKREYNRSLIAEEVRRSALPSQIVAYFNSGSSLLRLDDQQKYDINNLLSRATSIDIRGRTDGSGGDELNDSLALARATAAKQYLLGLGAVESTISINYSAENNYISDENDTKGRFKNRRVEIEFELPPLPERLN